MIIESPIGNIRVFCEDDHVVEVLLPGWNEKIQPSIKNPSTKYEKQVANAFNEYFKSASKNEVAKKWKELVKVSIGNKYFPKSSEFQSKVYKALTSKVPSSHTVAYGELAALAGSPLAARAAGNAMKKNPLPIIVPCHRVLPSTGELGNYMGSEGSGQKTKKWLLEHEGAI
ncbi:MAG: MGMT family protein [Acidimicrobiia bacterium]